MVEDVDETHARVHTRYPNLLTLLSNSLILNHVAPYLSASERLNLASTCRPFRNLILHTPGVFRHLDLTCIKTAQFDVGGIDHGGEIWRNVQLDEHVTEDDFYSGPLRGVFESIRRKGILQAMQTLILDGLSVTAELVHELILDPTFNVRILSIRSVKNLNERKLCRSLQYACRPTRPHNTPRLKALYVFGTPESYPILRPSASVSNNVDSSQASQISIGWNKKSHQALSNSLHNDGDDWYEKRGRVITRPLVDEWASALIDCNGIIAFDAVACAGPRHVNSPAHGRVRYSPGARQTHWAVATVALDGCAQCGSAPEGVTVSSESTPACLPLLAPPPLLSSSVKSATTPRPSGLSETSFVGRCLECIQGRYCTGCHRWWCEACYQIPEHPVVHDLNESDVVIVDPNGSAWVQHQDSALPKAKARVSKSCWECGFNCHECIERTQRLCRGCCGGYCLIHNEGSTSSFCDWCSSRGRFLRHL